MNDSKIKNLVEGVKNKIIKVDINADLKKANELMQTHNISLLSVYDKEDLIGFLHENTMWKFLSNTSK